MVNWLPIGFLFAGFTLLGVALNLAFLKYEMRGGKNLLCRGLCIMGLGVVVAIVGGIALCRDWLPSQVAGVLLGAATGIVVTGFNPALRGTIQPKKRGAQLNILCWSIFAIAIVAVAFIIFGLL